MGNIAKQSAVLITWFKKGACPQNQLTNLLARARSSSASDKSKLAHRPKHCTKPPIFDGMENPMAYCQSYQVRQLPKRNLPARVGSVATAEPDTTSLRA